MLKLYGVEIPESIDEFLIPSQTAHAVVDFQNDYCHPEGWSARNGGDVSSYPRAIELASQFVTESRHLGVLQIFVRMTALPHGLSDSPAWIRMHHRLAIQRGERPSEEWEACAVEGTWGAEIVDELVPGPDDVIIDKLRSSAFFGTHLDVLLRSRGIKTLLVSGCTTEGCVESTVRDASFRDYYPVVVLDAVCSDSQPLHEASMMVMAAYRADVLSAQSIIEVLRDSANKYRRQ